MAEIKAKKILVTGGLGFIGGVLIKRLLKKTKAQIINIDKASYSSDTECINQTISSIKNFNNERYKYLNLDLCDEKETFNQIKLADPDLIFHLAAESHVDRSINSPISFIKSNIFGTYSLLEAAKNHFNNLDSDRKNKFKFLHISTDEVYGSLGVNDKFNENSNYDPRSPYSATKASSDHLVSAWSHTYNLPIIISNCSNNFGPWQFPEKLIPNIINKVLRKDSIPIYGKGLNVRDWLYVEDHVSALLLIASKGKIGEKYLIGGSAEETNLEIAKKICLIIQNQDKKFQNCADLIEFVKDRPGHDFRYAIDYSKIKDKLGWTPQYSLDKGLNLTISWYLNNQKWVENILKRSGYDGSRLGIIYKSF
tara:strand:- start:6612 stop:7709 length:1098 start_codon:yes stop_codon:yes gene_type:complete